jgi:hypothetical protein
MASEPDVSTIVPPNRSTIRHRLPSTGSSGRVPPLHGYYSVLRLPAALPAALRCLRLAVPRLGSLFAPRRGEPACLGPGLGHPVARPGRLRGDDRASQVPGHPPYAHAPLSDPGGISVPGHSRHRDAAFRSCDDVGFHGFLNSRGSITRPAHSLCTLRSAGCPTATQHSVPAGGQPLPGGIGYPPGCSRGFPSSRPVHLIPPLQASPGATQLPVIPPRRHRDRFASRYQAEAPQTAGR